MCAKKAELRALYSAPHCKDSHQRQEEKVIAVRYQSECPLEKNSSVGMVIAREHTTMSMSLASMVRRSWGRASNCKREGR